MDSNGAMEDGQISMKFKSTVEDDDKLQSNMGPRLFQEASREVW
jgi:hypothetical protein